MNNFRIFLHTYMDTSQMECITIKPITKFANLVLKFINVKSK